MLTEFLSDRIESDFFGINSKHDRQTKFKKNSPESSFHPIGILKIFKA